MLGDFPERDILVGPDVSGGLDLHHLGGGELLGHSDEDLQVPVDLPSVGVLERDHSANGPLHDEVRALGEERPVDDLSPLVLAIVSVEYLVPGTGDDCHLGVDHDVLVPVEKALGHVGAEPTQNMSLCIDNDDHLDHPMILTLLPEGFSFTSSGMVIRLPPASSMALAADAENLNAATVTFLLMLPAPRTLPGTTTISPSCAYLSSLLRLTSAQVRLGFSKR